MTLKTRLLVYTALVCTALLAAPAARAQISTSTGTVTIGGGITAYYNSAFIPGSVVTYQDISTSSTPCTTSGCSDGAVPGGRFSSTTINVNSSTLALNNNTGGSFTVGRLGLNTATIKVATSTTLNGPVTLTGANTVNSVDQTGATAPKLLTLNGLISGTGSLTLTAATAADFALPGPSTITNGVTVFSPNTFSGGLTVGNGARLLVNLPGDLGSGPITLSGGALAMQSAMTLGSAMTLTNANTLTGVSQVVLSGVLSGTGSLRLGTAATPSDVRLSATNTFTGGVTIASGSTLTAASLASLGTGAVTNLGRLVLQSGTVTGSTLSTSNLGDLTLRSGAVLQASGTISAAASRPITSLTLDGGTLTATGALDVSAPLQPGAAGGTINTGNFAVTLSGTSASTAAGGLTLTGGNVVSMTGANAYRGATVINAGTTLKLAGAGIITNSAVTANGTFDISGIPVTSTGTSIAGLAGSGSIALGTKSLTVGAAGPSTFSGSISGTGKVTVTGGGLTLTGTNTFSGGLQIDSALTVTSTAALGTGPVSGTGRLIFNTGGSVSPSGSNSYSGGTMATGGTTLLVGSSLNLPYGSGGFFLDNGRLSVTSNVAGIGSITVGAGGGSILTGGSNLTASSLAGTGPLTITGTGSVTVDGLTSPLTGSTTIASGASLNLNGQLAASVTVNGTLRTLGTGNVSRLIGGLYGSGSVVIGSGTILTIRGGGTNFTGTVSGAGSLAFSDGQNSLGGANTYSGSTIISGGTLTIASGGNIGTGPVSMSGGTLQASAAMSLGNSIVLGLDGSTILTGGNRLSLDGVISSVTAGGGGLTVGGGNTVALTAANTLSGRMTVASGTTLALVGAGSLSASPVTVNGVFDISGATAPVSTIAGLGGSGSVVLGTRTLAIGGSGESFAGTIGGTGALSLLSGTQTLSGTNTHSGGTILGAGATLTAPSAASLGSGVVSGAGRLAFNAGGTVTLAGTNTYTGGTAVTGGTTLAIGAANAAAYGTGGFALDNGVVAATSDIALARAISLGAGGGTIQTGSTRLSLDGVISGAGGLTVGGGNTVALTAANTLSGGMTVASGTTLALAGAGSLSASPVTVNGVFDISGATAPVSTIAGLGGSGSVVLGAMTLAVGGSGANFAGSIGGTGTLSLLSGAHTLSGTNTHSGGTILGAGATLTAPSAASLGSGVVSGAGRLAFNAGGTVTLAGTNTYTGGTAVTGGTTLAIGAANAAAYGTGSVTLDNARLLATSDVAVSQAISVGTGGATINTGGNAVVVSGATSGGGSLALVGGGSVTFSGGSTRTGGTTGTGGTTVGVGTVLATSGVNPLGTGTLTLSGATLQANGNLTFSGPFCTGPTCIGAGVTSNTNSGLVTFGTAGGVLDTRGSTITIDRLFTAGSLLVTGGGTARMTIWTTSQQGQSNVTVEAGTTLDAGNAYFYANPIVVRGTLAFTGMSDGNVQSFYRSGGVLSGGPGSIVQLSPPLAAESPGVTVALASGTAYSGLVQGTGRIWVPNGTVSLAGTNSYTGGTTIGAAPTGTSFGPLAATISASQVTATNSDAGATSTAVLVASGTNPLGTGPIWILEGTLRAGAALTLNNPVSIYRVSTTTTFGSVSVTQVKGNAIVDSAGNPVALTGTISGSGLLTLSGGGTISLSGVNAYSGGTVIGAGTSIVASGASPFGTGALTFSGGTLRAASALSLANPVASGSGVLRVETNGNTVVMAGAISGAGGLDLAGPGRLTLQALNTYTGATNVNAGATLALAGSGSIAGSTSVRNNGTIDISSLPVGTNVVLNGLAGTGTVITGGIQLTVNGLRPGNSPGTASFNGSLSLPAGGSGLMLDIDGTGTGTGAGNYSAVVVTGGSFTANGPIAPVLRGITGDATNAYTPPVGQGFAVVRTTGGVLGSFAGLTQPAEGLAPNTRFDTVYTTNTLYLYVTPAAIGAIPGLTPNQASAGAALDRLRTTPGVRGTAEQERILGTLYPQPVTAYGGVLNRLGATPYADSLLSATRQAQAVGSLVLGQAAEQRGEGACLGTAAAGECRGMVVWASAYGRNARFGAAEGGTPFRDSSTGSLVGGEMRGGDWVGGVAVGQVTGQLGSRDTGGTVNRTDSYALAYGGYQTEAFHLLATAGAMHTENDTRRDLGIFGLRARGKADGTGTLAAMEAGTTLERGAVRLQPYMALRYGEVGRDGLRESGAGMLGLALRNQHAEALGTVVGLRASSAIVLPEGYVLRPSARIGWSREIGTGREGVDAAFLGAPGSGFRAASTRPGRDAALLDADLTLATPGGIEVFARTSAEVGRDMTSLTGQIGIRLRF